MIIANVTDQDEWNYLDALQDLDSVGHPNSANQGYYARILQYKYPQCQRVKLTATTFQITQPGISIVPIPFTLEQRARQRLLDELDDPLQGTVTKRDWLPILKDEHLLPHP